VWWSMEAGLLLRVCRGFRIEEPGLRRKGSMSRVQGLLGLAWWPVVIFRGADFLAVVMFGFFCWYQPSVLDWHYGLAYLVMIGCDQLLRVGIVSVGSWVLMGLAGRCLDELIEDSARAVRRLGYVLLVVTVALPFCFLALYLMDWGRMPFG